MVFLNRKSIAVLCLAGFILQSSSLHAWGFASIRNWAHKNPVKSELAVGGLAIGGIVALQRAALKYLPEKIKENIKEYPGRALLGSVALGSLILVGTYKLWGMFLNATENPAQLPEHSEGHSTAVIVSPDASQEDFNADAPSYEDGTPSVEKHYIWQRSRMNRYQFFFYETAAARVRKIECRNLEQLMTVVERKYPDYYFSRNEVRNELARKSS